MAQVVTDAVGEVRAFNRFYTGVIGVLEEELLHTPFSLTEARVIFELAQRPSTEVVELRGTLGLDSGYLSRILARLERDRLLSRDRSAEDARRQILALTDHGRAAFDLLDRRAAEEVSALMRPLGVDGRRRLVGAMETIRELLGERQRPPGYVLRPPYPGDLGWVVQRHGALYAEEHGWDERFEALVARVVADYVDHRRPAREAAWIADVGGAPVGCVFCLRRDEHTAQMRLLLVDPAARGLGIGARLVAECLRFAGRADYREIVLWTNDVLRAARRIYERAGFSLIEQEPHNSFGRDLVGQYWSRPLSNDATATS